MRTLLLVTAAAAAPLPDDSFGQWSATRYNASLVRDWPSAALEGVVVDAGLASDGRAVFLTEAGAAVACDAFENLTTGCREVGEYPAAASRVAAAGGGFVAAAPDRFEVVGGAATPYDFGDVRGIAASGGAVVVASARGLTAVDARTAAALWAARAPCGGGAEEEVTAVSCAAGVCLAATPTCVARVDLADGRTLRKDWTVALGARESKTGPRRRRRGGVARMQRSRRHAASIARTASRLRTDSRLGCGAIASSARLGRLRGGGGGATACSRTGLSLATGVDARRPRHGGGARGRRLLGRDRDLSKPLRGGARRDRRLRLDAIRGRARRPAGRRSLAPAPVVSIGQCPRSGPVGRRTAFV